MKFQYLGTAAAEGFPAMFCACDTCKRALASGGKNIRTRSQALIDDTLLIDFPADTYFHLMQHGFTLSHIKSCLVTHAHSDHFYPADLEMRRVGFAYVGVNEPFTIYGTGTVCNAVEEMIQKYRLYEENRVAYREIHPFEPFLVEGYTVTPLPANHDPRSGPVIFLIEKDGKALLYANDTGVFPEEVFAFLKEKGLKLNFLSIDCTAGLLKGWKQSHMGMDTCILVTDRLREQGNVDETTLCCLHHFSHNCMATYDEMLAEAQKFGYDVSYDGKIILL